jgi:carboxyl-terminal processing protease
LIQRDYNSLEDYLSYEDDNAADPPAGEVRHTDSGRVVYGGGGIRPDVLVDREPTSRFIEGLLRSQAFFNFAVEFNTHHKSVQRNFEVTQATVEEFQRFLDNRKIAWTPADIEGDRARLRVEIKQSIASTLWGMEEGYKASIEIDKQMQRAIELFPEAEQLASLPRPGTEQPH